MQIHELCVDKFEIKSEQRIQISEIDEFEWKYLDLNIT